MIFLKKGELNKSYFDYSQFFFKGIDTKVTL